MHVTFATPAAALVALGGVVAIAAVVAGARRLQALCNVLGLRPPPGRSSLRIGLALAAIAALLALAAAQPVVASQQTIKGRADVEAFFVFDVTRSMGARAAAGGPSRLDRARRDATALRARLGGIPVGVASLTDRVLPHLFPTVSQSGFDRTIRQALAVDRPTSSLAYGDSLGTKLAALGDLGSGNFFATSAKHRVVVTFTDGETLPTGLSALPSQLKQSGIETFFFRYWRSDERIYDQAGRVNPNYLPDPSSRAVLDGVATALGTHVFTEGQVGQAAAAIRSTLGTGPEATRGRDLRSRQLAPYLIAFAFPPLLFVLARRNLRRRTGSGEPSHAVTTK